MMSVVEIAQWLDWLLVLDERYGIKKWYALLGSENTFSCSQVSKINMVKFRHSRSNHRTLAICLHLQVTPSGHAQDESSTTSGDPL